MKTPKQILLELIEREDRRLIEKQMNETWASKRLAAKEQREELDEAVAWLNSLEVTKERA